MLQFLQWTVCVSESFREQIHVIKFPTDSHHCYNFYNVTIVTMLQLLHFYNCYNVLKRSNGLCVLVRVIGNQYI